MNLLWDELKTHIEPSEVDHYARAIGIAKITRNEDAFQELKVLKTMQSAIQMDLNDEIERKNPIFLSTPQRNTAIERAIHFLDSLREKGHLVEPSNDTDNQIMVYLKFAKLNRPNSSRSDSNNSRLSTRGVHQCHSARSMNVNMTESIDEIKSLLDEEYQRIQVETSEIRCQLFSSCDQLNEVKSIDPPSTDSIQSFAKRLKAKDVTLKNIAKTARCSSSISRLRESVRMNRIWE
ncbi:hypothetical protein TRFO_26190 [Tritrichomonas foetus]|uniref:Uncharacterized protein n=1 Tax=Tritrichomonas foetus TaxID=1144522 RepID=A0A1J4K4X4_9EUKA|nr:hypothetical protein TRFO_26190 [Tritrichomonas foetus]|eukprot:OHT05912.1 hypothetical protein TRFO_26190 [Tritrichomonas foetus]